MTPESDRERALRLLELDPEPGLGAPRSSLLRFAPALRRRLSRGRFAAAARRLLGRAGTELERGRLLLRLGIGDAAVGPLASAEEEGGAEASELLGEALACADRPGEALSALDRALTRDAGRFWARLWRAECLRRLGSPRAAAKELAAARLLRPRSPWPLLLRGRADAPRALDEAAALAPLEPWTRLMSGWRALDAGHGVRAEAELTKGLARAPSCKWGFVLRARARLGLGRIEAARLDMEAALAFDPEIGGALRAWRPGDAPAADMRALDAAIAARPGEGWLRAWRGQLHYDALRPERALDDLRRAVALDPACGWARALRARAESLWLGGGDPQEEFSRAFADSPGCGWILSWRGLHRARSGDGAGAGRDYAAAVSRHPYYALAYGWRSGRRLELGDARGALADLDAGAELDPSYGFHFERRRRLLWSRGLAEAAYEDMACAVRREGRFRWAVASRPRELDRAVAELDARLILKPGDDWARAWRGETRLAAGDSAGAGADLDAAVAAAPAEPWRRAWRAEVRLATGDMSGALADADFAIALDSRCARAWAARARALKSAGGTLACLDALQRVTELDFGAAWAYVERGRLLLSLGRRRDAARELRRALVLDPRGAEARRLLASTAGAA